MPTNSTSTMTAMMMGVQSNPASHCMHHLYQSGRQTHHFHPNSGQIGGGHRV
jgi:hypothetical protein